MRTRLQSPLALAFLATSLAAFAACTPEEAQPPPQTPAAEAQQATAPNGPAGAPAATADGSDEGMWLLNEFPSDRVAKKYGFSPTQAWLDHVRLSSVRLAAGCSGSIVSPNGLVMTNHHCAQRCISELSSAKKDLQQAGFLAKTEKEEAKCPGMEINELVEITNVTDARERRDQGPRPGKPSTTPKRAR